MWGLLFIQNANLILSLLDVSIMVLWAGLSEDEAVVLKPLLEQMCSFIINEDSVCPMLFLHQAL